MRKQKALITGGSGMLANDLTKFLIEKNIHVIALGKEKLDITKHEQVAACMQAERPDLVINTPCCHVEPCEDSPETAYAVNAWGPKNVVEECQRIGATMVQISTCGLFGDSIRAYHEYDQVVLKTCYAKSKHEGDKYVMAASEKFFILRLGWLYGGEVHHARNFIVARYKDALKADVMRSAGDKHGSPTYTMDVGKTILSLLDSGQYGLYHVANQGGCSRAGYVSAIVDAFGLNVPVEEVDSSHFPRKADVPDSEILTSFNLQYAGIPLLPHWKEALEGYVKLIKDKIA